MVKKKLLGIAGTFPVIETQGQSMTWELSPESRGPQYHDYCS